MSAPSPYADNIPENVLEQSFYWAMLLGDTEVSEHDRKAHQLWLAQSPIHQAAWQRIQMLEGQLSHIQQSAPVDGANALNRVAQQRQRRYGKQAGALLSVLLLLGVGLHQSQDHWRYDYATSTGEQETITLPSGARVYLDSQTKLDIERQDQQPLLRLYQGQILVDSADAPQSKKPRVITDHGRFIPVGTRFVVHKQDDNSLLAVTKGVVKITTPQHSDLVKRGQARRVDANGIQPLTRNGLSPDAWTDQLIEADNARLGDVLAALDQHYHGWLQYDAEITQLRVTGVFRLDDIEGALDSLQNSLPIQVDNKAGWWIRVSKK